MKKSYLLAIFSIAIILSVSGQTKYRSGIFLHHSTGGCIWGPNGSSTSVPQQMDLYNAAHGYTGGDAVTLNETWYPGWNDNEWCTWHTIFENDQPEVISSYFGSNPIIMIKSCFPSSAIEDIGCEGDTLYPDYKTIYNYKWHWRHIVSEMENHPENFFVIWTNAPLEWYSTNSSQAAYSDWFCTWAKDTLAMSLDPVFGTFPDNVYVFDFFHKLADENGFLPACFAAGPWDSHPNAAATELVAPQLVNEIFDAAIGYESGMNLDLKVFIEGPFNGTEMNTDLNTAGFIPFSQPYNAAPWYYSGSEAVTAIPNANVVDWVLVELRDASDANSATGGTIVAQQAAFLLKDGSIASADGSSLPLFTYSPVHSLFAVIRHRNHIAVMSSGGLQPNGTTYSWDFTTGAGQAFGSINAHKQIAPGAWGMTGADGNADNQVNNGDKNDVWSPQAGTGGYLSGDFNLDAQVNNGDKNDVWVPNTGLGGQVPN